MAFVLFWLPQAVYATALCLAMNRANGASVIYLPRVRKPRHSPLFGLRDDLGAVPSGEGDAPKFQFSKAHMPL